MKSLSCGGCGEDVRPGISCLIKDRMVWHAHCVKCAGCGDIVLPFESSKKDSLFCFAGRYYCGKCKKCQICSKWIDSDIVKMFPDFFTTKKNESNGFDIVHCECLGCECDMESCKGENTRRFPEIIGYYYYSKEQNNREFANATKDCARLIGKKILLPAHIACSDCNKPMGKSSRDGILVYDKHHKCEKCGECITDNNPNVVVNLPAVHPRRLHRSCATCQHCGENRPVKSANSNENCRKFYHYQGGIYHNDCIKCERCSKIEKGRYIHYIRFMHYTCPRSDSKPKKKRKISKK